MIKISKHICYGLIAAVFFCICSKPPTAGGSSDSGNVRFAGIIYHVSDGPAAQVKVTLCPGNYIAGIENRPEESDSLPVRYTFTDEQGRFEFHSVQAGEYSVEANDGVSEAVLVNAVIQNADIPVFIEDTLRPWSVLVGNTEPSDDQKYVVVYGLDRKIPVETDGHFRIDDLPEGTYRIRVISTDSVFIPVEIDNIKTTSDQTSAVPLIGWNHYTTMYLNTTITGADITSDIYDFPVVIRLTEDNFNFDEAADNGSDCRFTGQNGNQYPFEIERWDAVTGLAEVWVKVDTIYGNDGTQTITMYWGNPDASDSPNSVTVFDTSRGFQGVWHMGQTGNTTAFDATANHFNGTPVEMMEDALMEGMIGGAQHFDGNTGYITLEGTADSKLAFEQNGSYSLSAWVYTDIVDSSAHYIVSKSTYSYSLLLSKTQRWELYDVEDESGLQSVYAEPSLKQWKLLTGVCDGDEMRLYVDDVCIDSVREIKSGLSHDAAFDVQIGKRADMEGYGCWNGLLDEMRISNIALSADWIKLCYMNQRKDDKLVVFE